MTDQEIISTNAHIPDSEVLKDIADTEAEIRQMEAEAEFLESTPMSLPSAKWDHMRASGRRSGIVARKDFIAKLQRLLELRKKSLLDPHPSL